MLALMLPTLHTAVPDDSPPPVPVERGIERSYNQRRPSPRPKVRLVRPRPVLSFTPLETHPSPKPKCDRRVLAEHTDLSLSLAPASPSGSCT